MNITVIHSSPRSKGFSSTIALELASKFENSHIEEIHLNDENIPYCKGCLACVTKGMEYCPHKDIILPIRDKILNCDLLIVATPVYILHMNGQLKTFIDHLSSWFLMHRPSPLMFSKQLVVIATAAGPVYKNTLKEVSECFSYFGIPKIYKMGYAIPSKNWKSAPPKKKNDINNDIDRVVKKVNKHYERGVFHTPLKTKLNFAVYRKIQSKVAGPLDKSYWEEHGWFKKNRPWKSN